MRCNNCDRSDHDVGRREIRPKGGRDGETAQMTKDNSVHLRNPCSMLWNMGLHLCRHPASWTGFTSRESSVSITWGVITRAVRDSSEHSLRSQQRRTRQHPSPGGAQLPTRLYGSSI